MIGGFSLKLAQGVGTEYRDRPILGTPDEAGAFSFTVEAADAEAPSPRRSIRSISLTVEKRLPVQIIKY
jgi:hypothetical protein